VVSQGSLHGLRASLPHPGGALYVSEKKSDGTCRRAGHYYLDVLLASLQRKL
jgi:hypothetical protein